MSKIEMLAKEGLLNFKEPWKLQTHYEVIMGSVAYGVSNDTSDMDVYAVCTPPKEMIFPHMSGYIKGFGPEPQNFESCQQHHIKHLDKEYDIALYSIVNYFHLCADNNPNMIDSLFVPGRCVLHKDTIGSVLRDNRQKFLHKGAYHRYKGYAYQQLKKIKTKKPVGKRVDLVEKYGYDVKFAYHVVRLACEAEMIMVRHDLDLEENREQLKSIRAGEWTLERLEEWFIQKDAQLDQLYLQSTLRHSPDWNELKRILYVCLEEKFGSLSQVIDTSLDASIRAKYNMILSIVNS